ncbi:MAG: hypothetical protein JWO90_894 [Solirubrobacterales bacterium]|jgi:hypothetical protein|nr:hypothetical protein [Solirubrobacterales bacterium]
MSWKLVVRRGPKVVKSSHPELAGALRALEEALRVVPESGTRTAFRREYAPVQQVVARGEVRGPRRVRGGVDLRGDGSAEAWTGRLSKELVAAGAGETAYAALGRVLRSRVGG